MFSLLILIISCINVFVIFYQSTVSKRTLGPKFKCKVKNSHHNTTYSRSTLRTPSWTPSRTPFYEYLIDNLFKTTVPKKTVSTRRKPRFFLQVRGVANIFAEVFADAVASALAKAYANARLYRIYK